MQNASVYHNFLKIITMQYGEGKYTNYSYTGRSAFHQMGTRIVQLYAIWEQHVNCFKWHSVEMKDIHV